ncbi:hypothetical protein DRE_06491 [Drechslerella stenobrocha 248]|uniref:Uncharacterized protein n=1 Tax=Drechslerella stenobrocha 248 TaxID=1043628 RepID=W7HXR6_9PEZI|nr:hypothetical protein DRE_06491 [Drechslerella stenobrocha 248]
MADIKKTPSLNPDASPFSPLTPESPTVSDMIIPPERVVFSSNGTRITLRRPEPATTAENAASPRLVTDLGSGPQPATTSNGEKDSGKNEVQEASLKQQKLERLVYLTTRDVFVQSLFKAITRLSASTAQHVLKSHVQELAALLEIFKMNELVETVVKMHAQRVYASSPEVVRETWPWLLDGDITELSLIDLGSGTKASKLPAMKADLPKPKFVMGLSSNADSLSSIDDNSSTIRMRKHTRRSSIAASSLFADDACSIISFGPSNELALVTDPYGSCFPYPTQRTIFKHAQQIMKKALYEFTKIYFPDKLKHRSFEYSASSSLGQWVLMVQDAISNPEAFQDQQGTYYKLKSLGFSTLLDPASELHDLLSKREHVNTADLQSLLVDILTLIDSLGISECSGQQRALSEYVSALAADLKGKLEEVQVPFRDTLKRISDERNKLASEEEDATQNYRERERSVQQDFLLDPEVLKSILSQKPCPIGGTIGRYAINKPKRSVLSRCTGATGSRRGSVAAPNTCIWSPDRESMDNRPVWEDAKLPTVFNTTVDMPWDATAIDQAIERMNSQGAQENRKVSQGHELGPGLEGSRYAVGKVVKPVKLSKAIPIKAPPKSVHTPVEESELLISI